MPSCVFLKCTNFSRKRNKANGITYHTFPTDETMRHKWIDVVRKQRCEDDWTPTSLSKICSDHFDGDHKYSTNGRTLLKKTALPIFVKQENLLPRYDSLTSLDSVVVSEVPSETDTPEVSALKLRIQELVTNQDKIKRDNKSLKQQNKRLKKKYSTMQSILKYYKKRIVFQTNSLSEILNSNGVSEVKNEEVDMK